MQDDSPRAFETVVDRLLASPAYGERWGRHWLDVVRYADTAGETADYPVPLAWRYRNYVIDAFNADKPYDEFLREQIAGDMLANAGAARAVCRTGHRDRLSGDLAALRLRLGELSPPHDPGHDRHAGPVGARPEPRLCAVPRSQVRSRLDATTTTRSTASSTAAAMRFPARSRSKRSARWLPLLPPSESQPKWREFERAWSRRSAASLEQQKQPVPAAVLRSLDDIDGDFELQAPAAGGSNGVLVPPWLYEGQIAVTNAAQSPFKNLYPAGKVGASVPAGAGDIASRRRFTRAGRARTCDPLYVNLDFRVGCAGRGHATGAHRFSLGAAGASSAVEVLISSDAVVAADRRDERGRSAR